MTMAELVVAVAITGVIVTFLGTAITQIITVSNYGNSRNSALHELQNTAFWLKYDGERAVNASGDTQLVLTYADSSTITYSLTGTELRRISGESYMVLAQNISLLSFSVIGRLIEMAVTSNPAGQDDTGVSGTYTVYLRVEGGS
jgi:hypothetical protein